jgi:hypothetical protein
VKPCTTGGCDKAAYARGLCRTHYRRAFQGGKRYVSSKTCGVEDCTNTLYARSMCRRHYQRTRAGKDLGPSGLLDRSGPAHPRWNPENPGYVAVHDRVHRARGKASEHRCTCGAPAAEWSYDHKDPAHLLSDRGRPYSTNMDRYVPLCRPCHRRLDLGRIADGKA